MGITTRTQQKKPSLEDVLFWTNEKRFTKMSLDDLKTDVWFEYEFEGQATYITVWGVIDNGQPIDVEDISHNLYFQYKEMCAEFIDQCYRAQVMYEKV